MKTDVILYLNSCVSVPLKKTKWQRRNHTSTLTGTRHPAKSSVVFLTFMWWRIRKCRKLISWLLEHHLEDLLLALSPLNQLAAFCHRPNVLLHQNLPEGTPFLCEPLLLGGPG